MTAADAAAGPIRWTFASPVQRWLAVAAAVLAALSVVVSVNAARTQPQHRIRTLPNAAQAAVRAASVDATGCPATARCLVVQRSTGLDVAFARAFPAGRVLYVQATLDLHDHRTYRTSLLGLLGNNATVSLTAQCVPGAPKSTARLDRSTTSYVDLGGNSVIIFRALNVLVPGERGCGLALLLRTPAVGSSADAAALRLAHDPSAQLKP